MSHNSSHFVLDWSFLRLLRNSNMPSALVVLDDLPFIHKRMQKVCRSLVLVSSLFFQVELLFEFGNSTAKFRILFLLENLLECELFNLSLGAPAFGARFQHVDTSSVHGYTYKKTS